MLVSTSPKAEKFAPGLEGVKIRRDDFLRAPGNTARGNFIDLVPAVSRHRGSSAVSCGSVSPLIRSEPRSIAAGPGGTEMGPKSRRDRSASSQSPAETDAGQFPTRLAVEFVAFGVSWRNVPGNRVAKLHGTILFPSRGTGPVECPLTLADRFDRKDLTPASFRRGSSTDLVVFTGRAGVVDDEPATPIGVITSESFHRQRGDGENNDDGGGGGGRG